MTGCPLFVRAQREYNRQMLKEVSYECACCAHTHSPPYTITPSNIHSYRVCMKQQIDGCCFHYFVRNSLAALLEALCAWISSLDSWISGIPEICFCVCRVSNKAFLPPLSTRLLCLIQRVDVEVAMENIPHEPTVILRLSAINATYQRNTDGSRGTPEIDVIIEY